nr:hypothetical protein [Mesorhizobium ciceri]
MQFIEPLMPTLVNKPPEGDESRGGPGHKRAAIQHCIKVVTPPSAAHRSARHGAVKWCTDFVNDVAATRHTFDGYPDGTPNRGYVSKTDNIVTLPST